MYTKEFDGFTRTWSILDPDGDPIVPGLSEETADGLLSHLNR